MLDNTTFSLKWPKIINLHDVIQETDCTLWFYQQTNQFNKTKDQRLPFSNVKITSLMALIAITHFLWLQKFSSSLPYDCDLNCLWINKFNHFSFICKILYLPSSLMLLKSEFLKENKLSAVS